MLFVSAGRWRLRHCAAHKPLCFAPYDPIVHDSDPHAIVALGVRRQRLTDSALHYTTRAALLLRTLSVRVWQPAAASRSTHASCPSAHASMNAVAPFRCVDGPTERASELYNSQTIRASIYICVGTISLQYVTQAGNASFRKGQRQCAAVLCATVLCCICGMSVSCTDLPWSASHNRASVHLRLQKISSIPQQFA